MKVLVSDFDSTLTRFDFFHLIRARWPTPAGEDPWEDYVARRITHFEALRRIFARIRTSEADLGLLANDMELDSGLPDSLRRLHDHGWEVTVASAGCAWYIERLLKNADVSLTVHANPGTFDPVEGLLMTLPTESRFFTESTGVDKSAVVRDALERSRTVAFAGDGRPDLAPCLLVPPDRRFARGWLAEALTERGEGFHPFEKWSQIADHLVSC